MNIEQQNFRRAMNRNNRLCMAEQYMHAANKCEEALEAVSGLCVYGLEYKLRSSIEWLKNRGDGLKGWNTD